MFYSIDKLPDLSIIFENIINIDTNIDQEIIKNIRNLIHTIRLHHYETFKHSISVARISALLARKLYLCHKEIMNIALGALLHDLGKIKVKPSILSKPGRLTREEWQIIKMHPVNGVELLSDYPWSEHVVSVVAYHHERIDGSGYAGLTGDKIPLSAKIVCLADAFDAIISPRPYQNRRSLAKCWEELEMHSGTQFETGLIGPFIEMSTKMFNRGVY
ncbi:MAG: HD-GYP domain-containing protein [Bacillota bacterium]